MDNNVQQAYYICNEINVYSCCVVVSIDKPICSLCDQLLLFIMGISQVNKQYLVTVYIGSSMAP